MIGILQASGARPAWEFQRVSDLHNLPNNGHFTLSTLPFCNVTSILKFETLCFRIKDRIEKRKADYANWFVFCTIQRNTWAVLTLIDDMATNAFKVFQSFLLKNKEGDLIQNGRNKGKHVLACFFALYSVGVSFFMQKHISSNISRIQDKNNIVFNILI